MHLKADIVIIFALIILLIPLVSASDVNDTDVSDEILTETVSDEDILIQSQSDEVLSDNPSADLKITETVSNPAPKVGDTVTWTIVVVNFGPETARNVIVSEDLSDSLIILSDNPSHGTYVNGVWDIGDMNPQDIATLTLTTRVVTAGIIQNTVYVNSSTNDTNITNDYYSLNITVPGNNSTSGNSSGDTTNDDNASDDNSTSIINNEVKSSTSKHITSQPVLVLFLALITSVWIRRKE